MGEYVSVYERTRRVERAYGDMVTRARQHDAARHVLDILGTGELAAQEARLASRDYEYAETRADQLSAVKSCKIALHKLHDCILFASQNNLLGPADVAQLSAEVQQITDELQ